MFFKRLKNAERDSAVAVDAVARLTKVVTELEKKLELLEKKLPDYEEAVARGVDDVWNKALTEIANYDPLAYGKKENSIE